MRYAGSSITVLHASLNPGELQETPAVQRQFLDQLFPDHGPQLGGSSVHHRSLGRDQHRIADFTHLKSQGVIHHGVHLELDPFHHRLLEAGHLHTEIVQADRQGGESESPLFAGDAGSSEARRLIGNGQVSTRNHGTAIVAHRSGDGPRSFALGPENTGRPQNQGDQDQYSH